MSSDPNVLSYTTLPPNSRLQIERHDLGMSVSVPPRAIWEVIVVFVLVAGLVLVAIVAISAVLLEGHVYPGEKRWYVKGLISAFAMLGIAVWFLIVRFRRRRMPTVVAIVQDKMIVLTPEKFISRREFFLRDIRSIVVVPRGIGVNIRALGEIKIYLQGLRRVFVFRSCGSGELKFVVTELMAERNTRQHREG